MTFWNLPINSFCINVFTPFYIFFIFIKMSKNLSTKHYHESRISAEKGSWKTSKSFLGRIRKCHNMVVNATKISQKEKNINWLTIEKNSTKWKKCFIMIVGNYFNLKIFGSL